MGSGNQFCVAIHRHLHSPVNIKANINQQMSFKLKMYNLPVHIFEVNQPK